MMQLIQLALLSILLLTTGCSRSPQKELIHILEKKYANLYVNEAHKREVIAELKNYFKTNKLDEKNLEAIQKLINKLEDGHVVIESEATRKRPIYLSELEFVTGSNLVRSCSSCSPQIPEGKYKITEVNNLSPEDYFKKITYSVAASTRWGREYRLYRTLRENNSPSPIALKLLNHKGKEFLTTLSWKEKEITKRECVKGERISDKIYKLSVLNLWCHDPHNLNESRKEVFNRFKTQTDEALSSVKIDDFIILDLRENGGGGDTEVEYILNTFNDKSVFMYKGHYLKKAPPFKWMNSFFEYQRWGKEGFVHSNLSNKPTYPLYQNKMITLISAGCFSSCEGLASALKFADRSKLLGEKTHGGIGEPVFMPIKKTPYFINIPIAITFQKNSELFEGRGVYPDHIMIQNPNEAADTLLQYALNLNL